MREEYLDTDYLHTQQNGVEAGPPELLDSHSVIHPIGQFLGNIFSSYPVWCVRRWTIPLHVGMRV